MGLCFISLVKQVNRPWISQTVLAGYAGSGYLTAGADVDQLYTQTFTTTSPQLEYRINFTATGTYYIWLRGYAPNGAGDSVYISLDNQPNLMLTGFASGVWTWTNKRIIAPPNSTSAVATLTIAEPGLHVLRLWQREDGLRLDRIVLTTNSGYNPSGNGPAESNRVSNY